MKIRVAGHIPNSLVNGEGVRYVIFFNGCDKHCNGCHNESFKDFNNPLAVDMDIEEIIKLILKERDMIDGVTLSGGDPMCQKDGVIELCKEIKKHNLNVWLYTGRLIDKIDKDVLELVDVVVDGPFVESLKEEGLRFRGSTNQGIYKKRKDGEFHLDLPEVLNYNGLGCDF